MIKLEFFNDRPFRLWPAFSGRMTHDVRNFRRAFSHSFVPFCVLIAPFSHEFGVLKNNAVSFFRSTFLQISFFSSLVAGRMDWPSWKKVQAAFLIDERIYAGLLRPPPFPFPMSSPSVLSKESSPCASSREKEHLFWSEMASELHCASQSILSAIRNMLMYFTSFAGRVEWTYGNRNLFLTFSAFTNIQKEKPNGNRNRLFIVVAFN
jgi:hypothetical protein